MSNDHQVNDPQPEGKTNKQEWGSPQLHKTNKQEWISPQLREFGNLSFVVKGISYRIGDGISNLT